MDVTALFSVGRMGAATPAAPTASGATPSAGMSFADMLGQVIQAGVSTIQGGESAAIQGLTGATPPFKVVEAVMEAQRTLQQGLSIRDKVVSAYQEIARMQI